MGENPKVFISHASEDKDRFVRAFATALRENGVDAWVDEWEIRAGDSLVKKIFIDGLQGADAVIAVISRNSINSKWVSEELDVATVEKINRDCKLIPIILDNVNVSAPLRHLKWIRIENPSEYSQQLHEILLSLFGKDDKPQLGSKPSFFEYSTEIPEIEGLRPDEALLLKLLGEIAIKQGSRHVQTSLIGDRISEIGVDRKVLPDIIEILESKAILKGTKVMGIKTPVSLYLSDFGMSIIAYAFVNNFEENSKRIGLAILNDELRRSSEISRALKIPQLIVNVVIGLYARKDWVRIYEVRSGDIVIRDVRAGLKRAL